MNNLTDYLKTLKLSKDEVDALRKQGIDVPLTLDEEKNQYGFDFPSYIQNPSTGTPEQKLKSVVDFAKGAESLKSSQIQQNPQGLMGILQDGVMGSPQTEEEPQQVPEQPIQAAAPPPAPIAAPKEPKDNKTLDFQGTSQGSAEGLEQAQNIASTSNLLANLGRAANTIGSAIAQKDLGGKEIYDSMEKQGQQTIQNYKEKVANEKNDPNSAYSQGVRSMLQRYGYQVKGNPTAAQIEAVLPFLSKEKQAEEISKARKEARQDYLEQRQTQQEDRKRQQNVQNLSKYQDAYNKDKLVVKAQEGLNAALDSEQLLNTNNPITSEAVKTSIARLSGEVGVLTDRDVSRFGGSKALADRLEQAIQQRINGKLTDQNREFLQEIISTFKANRQQQLEQRALDLAKQGSKRFDVPLEEAYDYLRPGQPLPKDASSQREAQSIKPSKQPLGKPKQVIQNGHTYTLNEQTGEYE